MALNSKVEKTLSDIRSHLLTDTVDSYGLLSKPVGDLNDGGGKLLPVSYDSYVSRLHSFTIINWGSKPLELSPLACARTGWRYESSDSVSCDFCHQTLNIILPKTNLDFYKRTTAVLAGKLKTEHRPGCIWLSGSILCPEYFLTCENIGGPTHEDRLILRCKDLQKFCDDFDIEFELLPHIEDRIEVLRAYAGKIEIDMKSLVLALHGWNVKVSADLKTLQCDICCRRLSIPNTDVESSTKFDIRRHLNWCPWIRPVSEHRMSITDRLCDHITSELKRKRRSDSEDYRKSSQRTEDVKELTKFMRRSMC